MLPFDRLVLCGAPAASASAAAAAAAAAAPAALVAVHGMLGDRSSLRDFCKGLEPLLPPGRVLKVYLVDLPGHGGSGAPEGPLTVPGMAAALLQLLQQQQLENVLLLGHSLGGQVCMCAALGAPQGLVGGLCVIDISPINYFEQQQQLPAVAGALDIVLLLQALAALDLTGLQSPAAALLLLQQQHPSISDADGAFLLQQLQQTAPGGPLQWRMAVGPLSSALQRRELCWGPPEAPTSNSSSSSSSSSSSWVFGGPVLLFKGSKSPWIDLKRDTNQILSFFPKAKIEVIQDAGHSPHKEQPLLLQQQLIQFFFKN
ncbi:hypothetical protein, conserved [Eimeria tenella]|uniref:AB hydrolase-1 domain-containing protein n=1 Tax=Eimeria tenella TaxID=5802 RepID=U6KN81_EIMTE|nr:hypothetical protein, conserved [Eimeria tenella]CDJ38296.1 hypothetical protein, conserved [Eimeria tenella]|eukprot:XP_013229134.1 hypothetical protein, conserved [Eimeria tenella]